MTSSKMWAHNIADALRRRGVALSGPATDRALSDLARNFGEVNNSILSIYTTFDGFAFNDFDALSEIRIWTIDEIISDAQYTSTTDPSRVRFADFSMQADIYCCDWVDPTRHVVSAFSTRRISSSWELFWLELTTGALDRPG